MELNELGEELVWQGEYNSNSDYTYHLKLKENNVCELVIKDKFNNVIEKAKGDTLFVDGVLFVKKINIEKASNYSKLYEDDLSVKLMFCIYKKENGKIVLRDATSLVMNVNNIKMDRLFSK